MGTPSPGVICKISDDGEIMIKTPAATIGYYKETKLTDELFDEGFLSPFLNVFRKGTSAVESATHVVTKSIGEVFFLPKMEDLVEHRLMSKLKDMVAQGFI